MKNHFFLCCLLDIFFCTTVSSQQVSEKLFGLPEWDNPIRVWQMPDGNIAVVTGHSDSTGSGAPNYLYHLDPNGAVVAQYALPQLTYEGVVDPRPDGTFNYGCNGLLNGAPAYFHYRMNLSGQPVDSIMYAGADLATCIGWVAKSAPDGGFVGALTYDNNLPGQAGVIIVRVDPSGNVVYKKNIISDYPVIYGSHLAVLPNGRVAVTIIDYSQGSRVVCLSPAGAILWTKGLPQVPVFDYTQSIPAGNDEFAIFGDAGIPLNGFAAVYKQNGSFAWNLTFNDLIPRFNPVTGFVDGNAVVLAGEYFTAGDIGMAVVKVAHDGQVAFAQKFSHLGGYSMTGRMDLNGNYVFSGFQWKDFPFGYQSDNGYVLCLQPDGTLNWFAGNDLYKVNRINDLCQLDNGDIAATGVAVEQSGAGQNFENFLFHVSDVGPLYAGLLYGKVVRDSIENCEPDNGEPRLEGWVVKAETPDGDRYAVTDVSGNYKIRTNASSANISVSLPNDLWQPCEPSYAVAIPASDTASLDIPVRQTALCPLLTISGSTAVLRRCFDNTYWFNWCNKGTAVAQNTLLTITLDSFTTYVSSSLPPASLNGQEVVFDTGDLPPEQCANLKLVVHTSCAAEPGQVHCLDARIAATETCSDHPHAASLRECQPNVGSYDPNDKRAFVYDTLHEGYIRPNTDIEYQIRFQNTGTDTAFNVVIVDTISSVLDINTLRPGVSSHPCTFQLQGDNVVKFVFDHILLPDSNINEAASHGFVNYKISQKPDLPSLTSIGNKADIYFDYNHPVSTNRHQLIVNKSTSVPAPPSQPAIVDIYPNPAHDGLCRVECRDEARTLQRVAVFDATGRQCLEEHPGRSSARLVLPEAKGLYWVRVLLDDGQSAIARVVR